MLATDVVMFNDHVAGPATGAFVTTYASNGVAAGLLLDDANGQQTPYVLRVSDTGASFENATASAAAGTDASELFSGKIDFASATGASIALSGDDTYTHSFERLDSTKSYEFAGTAIRGRDTYTNRWTLVTLVGADAFTPAHSIGEGVVTSGLAANEVAIWTGSNHLPDQGFIAQWTGIDPGGDGEFQVESRQYLGLTPGVGTGDASGGSKGYGLVGVRVIETELGLRVVRTDPANGAALTQFPSSYTVEFNTAFDPTTLQASDLTLDGVAATAVEMIDVDSARFTLPATAGEGLQTVHIGAGEILSVGGTYALEEFTGTFSVITGPGVVINEIHYDSGSDANPWEFVELYNSGSTAVDLSGWSLSQAVDYTLPADTMLGSGEYLIVAQNPAEFTNHFGVPSVGPFLGRLSNGGEVIELRDAIGNVQDEVDYNLGFPWPTIGEIAGHSIQLINPNLENDRGGNWRSGFATPGATSLGFTLNAPPIMRQVSHSPTAPTPGQDVTITMKVTDPQGVQAVTLEYQLVDPGNYIEIDDPRYETNWTSLAMHDSGLAGDAVAGDDVYSATIPGDQNTHRRLVRYRVTAADALGVEVTAPYADDGQPNFAYFVYGDTPDWTAAAEPGATPEVTYDSQVLNSVATYHLITTKQDHVDAQYLPGTSRGSGYTGSDYLWQGTLVYDGQVYDHIRYRARGGVWRYAMGKNMWKFDFNRGHEFAAMDDSGHEYENRWSKLNLSAAVQQGNIGGRGEHGLFEAAGFKLFDLAGVEGSNTNYVSFRIVEDSNESGASQYDSDFQGLYLAIEQPDGRLLDAEGLPDGNLYKMENNTGVGNIGGELKNQGDYPEVSDSSDLIDFKTTYESGPQSAAWWQDNFNLESYYSYRSVAESIRHYDIWAGKNYYYYHNPETDRWQTVPWDLDLTWSIVGGSIGEPFRNRVLDIPQFERDYQNRLREFQDLLYNPDQTGAVIDEIAARIYTQGEPSLVDADRAMWDHNPIMTSGNVNSTKSGAGRYYAGSSRVPATGDFEGMLQYMKDYLVDRTNWVNANVLTTNDQIPLTPTITYTGVAEFHADGLQFSTTGFSDPSSDAFAGMEWRIGEISNPSTPLHDADQPWRYEIDAVWESGELGTFSSSIDVTSAGLKQGHTYRARVRMQDDAGYWSRWSDPLQFVAGAESMPSLAITELHYHPSNNLPDEDDGEFIEIMNIGGSPVGLDGIQIADFAQTPYVFSGGQTLEAGKRIVVPRDIGAFQSIYGMQITLADEGYGGRNLSNGGETISLRTSGGQVIQTFTYDDAAPWPEAADGDGFSLELIDPSGDPTNANNWQASLTLGGTPGALADLGQDLIGDYNRNGSVEQSDYVLWKQTYGSTTDLRADGNNNGVIDTADYTLWRDNQGVTTSSSLAGDYNRNDSVELSDYALWKQTYGSTTDLRADGNNNGVIDAADYTVWRDNRGATTAQARGETIAQREITPLSSVIFPEPTEAAPAKPPQADNRTTNPSPGNVALLLALESLYGISESIDESTVDILVVSDDSQQPSEGVWEILSEFGLSKIG